MPNTVDHISEQIFKTIKGFGNDVVLFTDNGQRIVDPADARRFYIPSRKIMINYDNDERTNEIIVNLSANTEIEEVQPMLSALRTIANRFLIEYTVRTFGKTIGPKDFSFMAKSKVDESFYDQVKARRKDLSNGWRVNYYPGGVYIKGRPKSTDVGMSDKDEQFVRTWFKKKHRRWTIDSIEKLPIKEGFSGWHGSARKSINELGDAKIIVRHNRSVTEEREIPISHRNKYNNVFYRVLHNGKDAAGRFDDYESAKIAARKYRGKMKREGYSHHDIKIFAYTNDEKIGARTRQIESIFIENAEGERFKFPNKNLTAAKAMLKHVNEGGAPHDDFGQHIYAVMEELEELKKFQRYNRRNNFFESEQEISEEINNHVIGLRSTLKQISGPKGYTKHFESFCKCQDKDADDEQINELRDAVTIQYFDERVSSSLPYVAKIIERFRTRQEKEQEIIDFARMVMKSQGKVELNRAIDFDDPEGPAVRRFNDGATQVSAWINFMSPYIKDDVLVNKMMQVSDTVFEVGSQHINIAMQAINVIKKNATVSESTQEQIIPEDQVQLDKINESLNKNSNIKKLFS